MVGKIKSWNMMVLSQEYIFMMIARGNILRKEEKKKTSYFKLCFIKVI